MGWGAHTRMLNWTSTHTPLPSTRNNSNNKSACHFWWSGAWPPRGIGDGVGRSPGRVRAYTLLEPENRFVSFVCACARCQQCHFGAKIIGILCRGRPCPVALKIYYPWNPMEDLKQNVNKMIYSWTGLQNTSHRRIEYKCSFCYSGYFKKRISCQVY